MKERGRASFIMIAGLAALVAIIAMFFLTKPSPAESGAEFMDALARGDTAKLTELSYMEKNSKEQIRQKWQDTMEYAAKYYHFAWTVINHKQSTDDKAAVIMKVAKDMRQANAFDEKYELPMVKVDGKWLVDVRRISRSMFPGLPR